MRTSLAILLACLCGGCTPSTHVVKDPGQLNRGVRFYRPKPYLRVVPHQDAKGLVAPEYVALSIEYLPDYGEEYAIRICSGLGVNKTKITLKDGWNLTQLDVDLDAQFDENLKAVGELVSKLPIATAGGEERPVAVRATNVPLGYYEAVISRDQCGEKRLYGWRYVGFMPYAQCPVESTGVDCSHCQTEPLYALVFENGVMTFKLLGDAAQVSDTRRITPSAIQHAALAKVLSEIASAAPEALQRTAGRVVEPNGVTVSQLDDDTVQLTFALDQTQYDQFAAGPVTAGQLAQQLAPLVHRLFGDNRLNVNVLVIPND